MKKFFTADYHAGHYNILHLCNRPFKSIFEMEQKIIENHNAVVSNYDIVYNLGDVGFRCTADHVAAFLRLLNGKHHIILGNHDKPLRQALQRGLIEDLMESGKITIIGYPLCISDSTITFSKMLNINSHLIYIGHYPCHSWPSAFKGSIALHGHCHGNLVSKYNRFDVGVDTNDFKPYELTEILELCKNRPEFSEK